jgi:hypothetical protein
MRILFALSLVLSLFSPLLAGKAQANCLLCGIVGYAIGSSGNDEKAGGSAGGSVIYVAPHIDERIADPLAVRVASERFDFSDAGYKSSVRASGATLAQLFAYTVEESEKYTVLEITRVVDPEVSRVAVIYFAYIESEMMKPLSAITSN